MNNWNGEYKVKCPKCGCKRIWAFEHVDAVSEHLIDNGEWLHDYDNNEYGDILYTEFCCDKCGHSWRRNLTNIDSLLDENKNKRRKRSLLNDFRTIVKQL